MRVSSILWPRPHTLQEYWSSDAGTEFLDKYFSTYLSNSPVFSHTLTCDSVDIDGLGNDYRFEMERTERMRNIACMQVVNQALYSSKSGGSKLGTVQ